VAGIKYFGSRGWVFAFGVNGSEEKDLLATLQLVIEDGLLRVVLSG
jgi:hypothetical protein